MKTLPRLLQNAKRYLRKESPIILSCVGAAGVVATTVLAIHATPKAVELLDEADELKKEQEEELTVVDKVKIVGPVYIPTIVAGVTTVGCILGSNVLSKKQQVSLIGAYSILDSSYKEYRNKVRELCGKDTDILVQDEISKDRFLKQEIQPIEQRALWYEPYRDEFFEKTEKEVIDAEYHINRDFALRGESNLNEFYEFLGLEPTDTGCEIGWDIYTDDEIGYENMWIDFEHHLVHMEDGTEYYRIEIIYPSRAGIPEG